MTMTRTEAIKNLAQHLITTEPETEGQTAAEARHSAGYAIEETLRLTPERSKADEIEARVLRADAVGTMYAYGRMDQGHEPVIGSTTSPNPNPTDSAWTFGRMYAEQERAFAEGQRGHAYGLQSAWENFVANKGTSIDQPSRTQQATTKKYVAIINTPGYLPDSAESAPVFDTPREAWRHLMEERQREEDEVDMNLDSIRYSVTAKELAQRYHQAAWDVRAMDDWDGTGSVTGINTSNPSLRVSYEVQEVDA